MTTSVFLNNDRTMPLLGLGLYKTTDAVEAEDAIAAAVQNGYRLLDTASAYKNEEFVGCGIAKCGVPRKDLFITTKIWNNAQRLGDVEGAFQPAKTGRSVCRRISRFYICLIFFRFL